MNLEEINPELRVSQVSMGTHHMVIIASHRLMGQINTSLYIEKIHKVFPMFF